MAITYGSGVRETAVMNVKRILVLLSAILLLSAQSMRLEASDERLKPNVLFIAIDDLNDWVGCLGGHPQAQTPNIDRLARRGTLMTNAHCQSPLCNSSRTSLLTGMRPSTTGVYALAPWFRTSPTWQDWVSLPQYFAKHGYRTYSTGKVWHNGLPPKDARPNEADVWGPDTRILAKPPQKIVPPTPLGNHPLLDWGTFPHRDEDKGDWQVGSWAVEQLNNPPEEPFFLAAGFFLPHVPCYATQSWFDLYPLDTIVLPPVKANDREDIPEFSWYLHWKLPEPRLSWLKQHDQWERLVQAYLACTSFVDSQVGRLLAALDANGLASNTIVVLWSDHGWHLGEKGMTGKTTLWQRSTHVPLIFAGPGVARHARCGEPAELLDIFPTLIELCGLPPRSELEGHSLVPQLRDANIPRAWPAITTHNQNCHSIRSVRWRYIRYADGSEELYDVVNDPHEWTNLANDPRYREVIDNHAKFLPTTNVPPMPGSKHRLLTFENGQWVWEGEPIDPADKME
jgi:choline-sulfatase